MKQRYFYVFAALFACFSGYTQIKGGFYTGTFQGQACIYFQGTNVSGNRLYNLKVYCVNEILNQQQEYTLESLDNNGSFELGPANNWMWQPGEKLYVVYSNGQSVYWVYATNPNAVVPDYTPDQRNYSNKAVIRARISELEYKLKDAERSLRSYERSNNKNPSATGMMLIIEQQKLIQTYRDQIRSLTAELYR